MRFVILSGEASGDLYGADLAEALFDRYPGCQVEGIGSSRMEAAGVTLWHDSRDWGAIGFLEGLKLYPRLKLLLTRVFRRLRANKPDLFIPIDFGAVNVRLAKYARKHGIKTLYYMPPGSWRKWTQGPDLPQAADAIATPFSWSAELLSRAGARAEWIGHPLLRLSRPTLDRKTLCEQLGLSADKPIVALLPGSRKHEVSAMAPLFLKTAKLIRQKLPGAQFVVSQTRFIDEAMIKGHEGTRLYSGPAVNILAASDAALCCSGTVTLEAAIQRVPMVIAYTSALIRLEGFIREKFIKLAHIGLPNIILDRRVCPEFVMREVTIENLAPAMLEILSNSEARHLQIAALSEVRSALDNGDSRENLMRLIAELL